MLNINMDNNDIVCKRIKKRIRTLLILSTLILFSLLSFILKPTYTFMCSDVIYSVTVWPEILEIIIDAIEVITYAISFAIIIYSIFRFSASGSRSLITTYCIIILLKYLIDTAVSFIFDGAVSLDDIVFVLIYFLFDAVILTIIVLCSARLIDSANARKNSIEKANTVLGIKNSSYDDSIFASNKFFSKSNPLQCSALIAGIVLSAAKIISRIRFDIYVGAPTSLSDAMWMVTYYISDILIALIVYAISVFMFSTLYSSEKK